MAVTFDDVKKRLESLKEAYTQDLAGVFEVTTDPKQIKLVKPLPLKKLEHFFAAIFGEEDNMPDIPLGGATIERFLIRPAKNDDVFTAKLSMSFSSADWPVMDGLTLSLKTLSFVNRAGHWSGSVAAATTAQDREFDVSFDWPEMIVQGHLVEDQKLAKARKAIRDATTDAEFAAAQAKFDAAVATNFASDDTAGLIKDHDLKPHAKARLDKLEIYAAPRIHYLRFDIAGSNLVQFHELILKSAELELIYAGGTKSKFTGSIDTLVVIGQSNFHLNAAKTETGWTAKAIASSQTTVAKLVDEVSQAVFKKSYDITDFGIPDDFAKKTIKGHVILSIDTAKSSVGLELGADLDPADHDKGSVTFNFDITKNGVTAKGKLQLGDLKFEVDFSNDNKAKQPVMAAQFESEKGLKLKLHDLVKLGQLSDTDTVPAVDMNLSVTLRDVLLAGTKSGTKMAYVLAADLDGGLDLSGLGDLPLVGSLMPSDMAFELSLAPIMPYGQWSKADVKALNKLRGKGGPTLPEEIKSTGLGVSFKSPGHPPEHIDLPLESDPTKAGDEVKPKPPATGDDVIKWKDLQRKFGPVSLNRVGAGLDRKSKGAPLIKIAMDGGLEIAGLELALIGLGGHYSLKTKELGFDLKGLGLQFERGPLKIAGAFANMGTEYLGKATLGTKSFTLSAMGGFAMITDKSDGHKTPSMFLYGVLNVPLGGPAFFFVEGLAAGFGYNRRFTKPELSEIREFPFVKDAVGASNGTKRKGPSGKGGIAKELELLHKYITPDLGQYFAAIGVKFTSFKLLDSFVLLVVSFGREVEIDILGVSTYQMPPIVPKNVPALARIELNLDASFRPATGDLKVRAELGRNSYVYSSLCHLSGGFAFYSWFGPEHAGDFVLTAGGYHPDFKRKEQYPHYPKVNRISLTYQINSNIYVKGSAYFALTPSMFMAGGSLSASAKFGKVSASFTMSVDFMISWEPYFYRANAKLDIRARWWKFHTHAYAELAVWGPSFTGYAKVHWSIVSFDVSFGSAWIYPPAVSFDKFCESFLPHDKGSKIPNIAPSLAVSKGQIEEHALAHAPVDTNDAMPVINPKTLEIRIDTIVPAKTFNGSDIAGQKTLGCAPMNESTLDTADLSFSILDANNNDAASHFKPKTFTKPVPRAMWGTESAPSLKKDAMIEAVGGFTLTPAAAPKTPKPEPIYRSDCAFDIKPDGAFSKHISANAAPPKLAVANGRIVSDALNPTKGGQTDKNRSSVLEALNVSENTTEPRADIDTIFREAPVIVRIT